MLFEVFAEARAQGVNTPKIAFLLPFSASADAAAQLRSLYRDIYEPGRCQELWFYWKGRPLIMAYPDALKNNDATDKAIKKFFTFRHAKPSYTEKGKRGQWGCPISEIGPVRICKRQIESNLGVLASIC